MGLIKSGTWSGSYPVPDSVTEMSHKHVIAHAGSINQSVNKLKKNENERKFNGMLDQFRENILKFKNVNI